MVKFGRKFFFDKVHTKKNYTLPLIITAILIVLITTTFIITRYFKEDKKVDKTPKVVVKNILKIEVYSELPKISEYIKEIKNIKESDLKIIYPEELVIEEITTECENSDNSTDCKKQLATNIGEYKIIINSKKLTKEKTVTLKVEDTTAPTLKVKEVVITEDTAYKIEDFIESCNDNSKLSCSYEYANGKDVDYSKYTKVGEHLIKLLAKDSSNNKTEIMETKLTIKKKATNNNTEKPKTCEYGDLKYSDSYVIATRINNSKCAVSAKEASDLGYKPGIVHNKKLVKEIQTAYLKNTIDKMNLGGEIVYDITYGPVFNTSNKGVVGYYLLSEARQTIDGKTTTLARYFIDENGNRVWKVNVLNLK